MGHFHRMVRLALALESHKDCHVYFACQENLSASAKAILQQHQFTYKVLSISSSHTQMLRDAVAFYGPSFITPDMLIVDDPYIYPDPLIWTELCEETCVVRVDHPWARRGTCHMLILPHMHILKSDIMVLEEEFGENLLYGSDMVILGEKVTDISPRRAGIRRFERTLVFSVGGASLAELLTLYDMTSYLEIALPHVRRIYLVGEEARQAYHQYLPTFTPNGYITGFSLDHIRRATLCVSMFGVTAYEALYLRTPVLCIARQREGRPDTMSDEACIRQLVVATSGAVEFAGSWPGLDRDALCEKIFTIFKTPGYLESMHAHAHGHVDGKGAVRIAARLHRLL